MQGIFSGLVHAARLLGALSLFSFLLFSASAQEIVRDADFPVLPSFGFSNGTDLATGEYSRRFAVASIGNSGGLTSSYTYQSGLWNDLEGGVYQTGFVKFVVKVPGYGEEFRKISGVYTPYRLSSATLVEVSGSGGNDYLYTASDGAVLEFTYEANTETTGIRAKLSKITRPDGEVVDFHDNGNVRTSLGYQYHKADNNSLINLGYEYCALSTSNCSNLPSSAWPSGAVATNVTNAESETTTLNTTLWSGSTIASLVRFTSPEGVEVEINKSTDGKITSVTKGGGSWSYAYASGSPETVTQTSPTGRKMVSKFDVYDNLLEQEVVPSGSSTGIKTTYTYTADHLIDEVTYPEGNKLKYTYDSVGRVTEIRSKSKSGSGVPDMVQSFTYTACNTSTRKYCTKPLTITDARGQVTHFTYASAHGGVTRIRYPQPTSGSDWYVEDFVYQQKYAWYRTSSSTTKVQAPTSVWRLTQHRRCRVASSATLCPTASGASVAITDYAYESGNASTASNLNLTSVTQRAGDSSVSSSASFTYDTWGRITYVDGPLSGNADRILYEYDRMGRTTRTTSPDPDGSGSQWHRYTEVFYNDDGQVETQKTGRVNGFTGSRTFTPLMQGVTTYNTHGLPIKQEAKTPAGATLRVSQQSYDTEARPECVAQRMNSATFGSLPASACTQAAGGYDRISKAYYDSYGRINKKEAGVGTSLSQDEIVTFTNNGQIQTITDARGKVTTYEFDGLDRLKKVRYPNKTGSGSSTTDYEQYTFKVEGGLSTPLMQSTRQRDGQSVSYSYDLMSRMTTINAPGTVADQTITYDALGNQKTVVSNGQTLTYDWDALGRLKSEQSPQGTVSYLYDAASRRTRLTYTDGQFITYNYNTVGALTNIKQGTSTTLITYGYDQFGRRTSKTYGNGVSVTNAFDTAALLSDMDFTLPSASSYNQQLDFTYNQASQLSGLDFTNSSYFPSPANTNDTFAYNGQNQMTTADGLTVTHDARGNMTSDGTTTFGYDIANRLTSAGGTTLSYDPASRLYQETSGGTTTRFAYDGLDLIAEYDTSGNIVRRYVHGPGMDDVLVWYEGSAVSNAARRYLVADQRGSIVLVTNNSGGVLQQNDYDAYGVPDSGNLGRFQYTGQIWLDDAGLYHYKARAYHPELGRFLQTDPIGYGDGLNMYAYVGGDPINFIDPSGMSSNPSTEMSPCIFAHNCQEDSGPQIAGRNNNGQEDELRLPTVTVTASRRTGRVTSLRTQNLTYNFRTEQWDIYYGLFDQQAFINGLAQGYANERRSLSGQLAAHRAETARVHQVLAYSYGLSNAQDLEMMAVAAVGTPVVVVGGAYVGTTSTAIGVYQAAGMGLRFGADRLVRLVGQVGTRNLHSWSGRDAHQAYSRAGQALRVQRELEAVTGVAEIMVQPPPVVTPF